MNELDASHDARRLMAEHGLHDWGFEWDTSRRYFGRCKHATKTISLSRNLVRLNDRHHVIETILHEIAHALAGPNQGHGPLWQRICLQIGCSPAQYYGPEVNVPSRVVKISF